MMVVYDVCSLYSLYIIGCYKLDLDTDCCEGYMTVNAGYIPDGHKAQDALYIYIYTTPATSNIEKKAPSC